MKLGSPAKSTVVQKAFASATTLVIMTFVIQNVIRFASTIILTRLLVPEAYGIVGILTSVAFTVTMITDVGLQAFMIRHPDIKTKHFRDAMWTTRFLRSVLLTGVFLALSGPASEWFGKPEMVTVFMIFSISFVLDGLTPISSITALSDGRIARFCLVDIFQSLLSFAITVFCALLYPTIYTIVYAILIASFLRIFLFKIILPDSFLVWEIDLTLVKEVLKFGRYIVASSSITVLITQIDKLVLGRFLDTGTLGLYFLALNLAMVPKGLAQSIASKSLYPAYSRMWNDNPESIIGYFHKSRGFLQICFVLGGTLMFILADEIIELIYDDRYRDASVFLRILIFGTIPYFANVSSNEFLVSKGITSTTFYTNLIRLCWIVLFCPIILLNYGSISFLIALSLTEYVAYVFLFYNLFKEKIVDVRKELNLFAGLFIPISVALVYSLS